MASNKATWVRNIYGASEPFVMPVLFAAGSTATVKRGEILELEGGNFSALDSDQAMSAIIAVANEEIKSGDLAGYYEVMVPRPGDIFEFALSAAAAPVVGASLYWSDSQTLATSGSNVLGYVTGTDHYPLKQGHAADGDPNDRGVTVRSVSQIQMSFKLSVSYYAALFA